MTDQLSPSVDPRHEKRIKLMQALFAATFSEAQQEIEDLALSKEVASILKELAGLDQAISQYAVERPLAEINKVDLAILRLVVFEAKHKKTPKKVLIDEAVELAKEFGTETSPKFINGVLGRLLMQDQLVA